MVAVLSFCMVPTIRIREALSVYGDQKPEILAANVLCFFPGHGDDPWLQHGTHEFFLRCGVFIGIVAVWAVVVATSSILERPKSILIEWCDLCWPRSGGTSRRGQLVCAHCEERYRLLVVRPFVAFWLMLRTHVDLVNSALFEVCMPLTECDAVPGY